MTYAFFNTKEPVKMMTQALNALSFSLSLYDCLTRSSQDINPSEEGMNMAVCALNFLAASNDHGPSFSLGLVFLNTFRAGGAWREMNANRPDISAPRAVINLINALMSTGVELSQLSPAAHR